MNRKVYTVPATIFFVLFFSTISYSQVIGNIFSSGEANKLFGNVIDTVSIAKSEFLPILSQTQNYVMFRISNGELTILGDGRKVLYPAKKNVDTKEIFNLFSKSKVVELLNMDSLTNINIELRQNTLTITYGTNTLEFALWCPPFCP